jgi:hypothetical protein
MQRPLTVLALFSSLCLPAAAAPRAGMPVKPVLSFADAKALRNHLLSRGYKARGGVDKAASDRDEGRSFPHFSAALTAADGNSYPFTMVGYAPKSGRPSTIRTAIIPLRMNFQYFGTDYSVSWSFEPGPAVANITGSPIYLPASYPNGYGQYGDQLQRAAFWNQMDKDRSWHVSFAPPSVLPAIDIEVTPETGTLYTDAAGNPFGDVLIDCLDSQAQTILQFLELDPDVLPIFVTGDVTAEALGYHTAYPVGPGGKLQTFVYSSWLDPALVDPILADVSTLNHEVAEWLNDPFTNNAVPDWYYPPTSDPASVCSGNPSLEVGDPQGNGPTYADFPTIPVKLHGTTYHLQQVVLWEWFTGLSPSAAFGGWFTFPAPSSLKEPAKFCP